MVADRSRFKLLTEGLRKRTQETYDTREDRRRDILDRSKTSGIPFFDPGIGEHLVEFLPYLAGSKDPAKEEGSPTYLVDLYVHRFIGPNEDHFICLAKTLNQPCPICEHRNKLRRQDEPSTEEERDRLKAEMESCRPKRYSVYAIWDRDNESKGVQLWTVAHWFVQKNLMSACRSIRGRGVVPFASPDKEEGKSIAFEIQGSKMSQQYTGWQLVERDDDIPDEILDSVPVLDELLDIPTYEAVSKAFWAGMETKAEPEEEEEDIPVRSRGRQREEEGAGCPYDGTIGKDFEKFEECQSECDQYEECYKLAKRMGLVDKEEKRDKAVEEPEPPQRSRLRAVQEEEEEEDEQPPRGRRRR